MINTGYLWPGLLRSNRVRTVKSTNLCDFKRWWKRNALPPPVYHTINNSDSLSQTRSDTGLLPSLESPRFFSLNLRRQPGGCGGGLRLESELKALQGKQRGTWRPFRHNRMGPDLRGGMGVGGQATPGNVAKCPAGLWRVSTCVSVSVRCAPRTWKHTWIKTKQKKTVSNKEKKGKKSSTQVSVEPKITLAWVTKSLAFFLSVSFLYRGGIQTPLPPPSLPKKKGLSFGLSVVMETSQVSVLPAVAPAVRCRIRGSLLKPGLSQAKSREAFEQTQRTDNLLLYIVRVNACWEPSHAAQCRKPQWSPLYCSVPIVGTYVREGLYVLCKEKKNKNTSSNVEKENKSDTCLITITVGRRGVLSSPVLLCNESH